MAKTAVKKPAAAKAKRRKPFRNTAKQLAAFEKIWHVDVEFFKDILTPARAVMRRYGMKVLTIDLIEDRISIK